MNMKTIRNLMGRAATPVVLLASIAMLTASPGCLWADVKLTGAGATFPYPLYSKWFDMYNKETGVQINYQSIGSGGGIQQVKAGTVDFGASDAPLTNARLKEMPRSVIHFPTVAGRGSGLQPGVGEGAAKAHAGSGHRDLHGQDHDME
jgi:phosphate transport system substrate-binding protein